MSKTNLFDDDEQEGEPTPFKTENEYAKRYDNWREKEELHKLEQKYGDKDLNSDASSSSDSEDESDDPEIPEQIETQFLKTLSLLKTKDPRIYNPDYKFFDDIEETKQEQSEENEEHTKLKKEMNSLAAAFADSDDDEADDGEIFKVEKKAPETDNKEDKLKAYLSGQVEHIEPDAEKDLAPLRALWSDPKISEDEAFLRDYILNKRYLDRDAPSATDKLLDSAALEADEVMVEEQRNFERAYNFRFEEPDHEFLKRYPRTMNSIRPKDDSRARKRAEVRTRKDEEKKRKMEEIARLKALKLKEIQEKIAKIKEVTGNEELAFKDEDIEGDFDPAAHDRRMRAIFDEHYYGHPDEEKPVFPDLDEELEIENWEEFEEEEECGQRAGGAGGERGGGHCEDQEFNMDADYDPKKSRATLYEEIKETLGTKRRNRKRKSKLAKLLEKEKPKFIPDVTDKSYDQYMEEYYKMDCEDVIGGDLPTRFKYREVVPNSFGLTVEEILLADDKELNKWASLKKTVKYRPEHVEKSEVKTYEQKALDVQLKKKMLPSLFKELPETPEVVVPVETSKKKKKKKNKQKSNETQELEENDIETETNMETESKDIETNGEVAAEEIVNNDRVDIKNKRKRKRKHSETIPTEDKVVPNESTSEITGEEPTVPVKAKKNKKDNQNSIGNIANINENLDSTTGSTNKQKDSVKNELNKSIEDKKDNSLITENGDKKRKRKKKKNKEIENKRTVEGPSKKGEVSFTPKKNNQTSKLNKTGGIFKKRNKFNNKNSKNNKNNKECNDNPLSKLSDGRLKAYGLNPKKYRSFLKYKKF